MRFLRADEAVSEVIGTVLLIAATITMMGGLAVMITSIDGPVEKDRPAISLFADAGADGWGTGDEGFTIQHNGGEPIERVGVKVIYTIDGTPATLEGDDLDGDWADGVLSIGESWSYGLALGEQDDLRVQLIQDTVDSHIVAAGRVRVGQDIDCSSDTAAPTVSSWTQTPDDVEPATVGSVLIEIVVADNCAGPDDAIVPHLEFRFDSGGWTDTGAMTSAGVHRWQGTIPDQTWSSHDGETLQYRVTPLTDEEGNTAASSIQSDAIGIVTSYSYVASNSPTVGSVADFANMQVADDSNAESTLTQGTWGTTVIIYATDGDDGSGATSETNILGAPDDAWASMDTDDATVIADDFDVAGQTGTITKVELLIDAHHTNSPGPIADDGLDIEVREGAGTWQEVAADWQPQLKPGSTPYDEAHVIDITHLDGSWSWSEISDLDLRAQDDENGDDDNVVFYIDALRLRVTKDVSDTLDIQLDWNDLPADTDGDLQIRYQVTADTYHVDVWDGTTWNTAPGTLNAGAWAVWTYTLTGSEPEPSAGTGPRIRIVDDTPGATSGTIEIDYARVQDT